MKRLHVHVSVENLASSVHFYSALFGAAPVVEKPDYAKWLIDDPQVNFAVSRKGGNAIGLNHLGVQVETEAELDEVHDRLGRANIASQPESCARCCYAESDKHWAVDPSGIVWEAYRTMGAIAVYGDDRCLNVASVLADAAPAASTVCCDAAAA